MKALGTLTRLVALTAAISLLVVTACVTPVAPNLTFDVRIQATEIPWPQTLGDTASEFAVLIRARDFSEQADSLHFHISFDGRSTVFVGKVDAALGWSDIVLPPVSPFTVCISVIGRYGLQPNGMTKQQVCLHWPYETEVP